MISLFNVFWDLSKQKLQDHDTDTRIRLESSISGHGQGKHGKRKLIMQYEKKSHYQKYIGR